MNHTSPNKQRRSLREALRAVLWRGRRSQPKPEEVSNLVGSGILRKGPSSTTIRQYGAPLSTISEERFDVDYDDYSVPDRFDVSSVATAVSMGQSLKPQLSLSSFEGHRTTSLDMPVSDVPSIERFVSQMRLTTSPIVVPSALQSGISLQASVIASPSLRPSSSTLRIRRSDASLRSETVRPILASQPSRGLLRKRSSIGVVRQSQKFTPPEPPPVEDYFFQHRISEKIPQRSRSTNSSVRFDLPTFNRPPSIYSDTAASLQSVTQFTSFCVLDTLTGGCPVKATSKDLRYIFEIGEQFCLNNHGCEGASMDMVTGWDVAGNPITHLVLFSPLVIPSSGRSRFMLASLIDVTDFIKDTASLPDLSLETISEEGSLDDIVSTPSLRPRLSPRVSGSPKRSGSLRYELSDENLLGGCFVDEVKVSTEPYEDDIWQILATEERQRTPGSKNGGVRTPTSNASTISSVDDMLDEFMNSLQELYSDFFLLAKSPLDDDYYEICNVSPRVYAGKDYVHGHLSKTSAQDMLELSSHLAHDIPFTILVRWGNQGLLKQLYCIPLFARVSVTWVCFLVDPSLHPLWPPTRGSTDYLSG